MSYRFGFEVECLYRPEGKLGEHPALWSIHGDGSLELDRKHPYSDGFYTGEFIFSRPLSPQRVPDALDNLHEWIGDTDEFVNFWINRTCGAHIHFSVQGKDIVNNIAPEYLFMIREKAFKRVKEELPEVYRAFRGHYFRDYAEPILYVEDLGTDEHTREFEWTPNQGMEWRSFNLLGCRSWKQLKKMYAIATETIMESVDLGMEDHNFFSQSGRMWATRSNKILCSEKFFKKKMFLTSADED